MSGTGKHPAKTVLVTGATGYIGGRLVPRLLDEGHTVKVLVRSPGKLTIEDDHLEVIVAELDDAPAIRKAVDGADAMPLHLALERLGAMDGGSRRTVAELHELVA